MSRMLEEFERWVCDEQLRLCCKVTGFCPVQAEGDLNGKMFYFWARHDTWEFTLAVCKGIDLTARHSPEKAFFCAGPYGKVNGEEAGWMPLEEAEAIIRHCALLYLASQKETEPKETELKVSRQ